MDFMDWFYMFLGYVGGLLTPILGVGYSFLHLIWKDKIRERRIRSLIQNRVESEIASGRFTKPDLFDE